MATRFTCKSWLLPSPDTLAASSAKMGLRWPVTLWHALCGMGCSALVVNNIGGYWVCTILGKASSMHMDTISKRNPHTGVIFKMSSSGQKLNCSLSVSVICDMNGIQGPNSLAKTGACDYATVLRHPSGCAETTHVHGKGWGWFGTFLLIVVCLFGGYVLAGSVYRHFVLGIRGI